MNIDGNFGYKSCTHSWKKYPRGGKTHHGMCPVSPPSPPENETLISITRWRDGDNLTKLEMNFAHIPSGSHNNYKFIYQKNICAENRLTQSEIQYWPQWSSYWGWNVWYFWGLWVSSSNMIVWRFPKILSRMTVAKKVWHNIWMTPLNWRCNTCIKADTVEPS